MFNTIFRQIYAGHQTLGDFFAAGYVPGETGAMRAALSSFSQRFLALDFSPLYPGGVLGRDAGVRWFFPDPEGKSACKRLNLYLRWMTRTDGFDLGLWPQVSTGDLLIPLDTHVARICGYLGLTQRKTVGWAMVEEVTDGLKRLHAGDPIRYDWAISRLGILGHCPSRRHPQRCVACRLFTVCAA